jgi:tetratricopeptide (TPR) repeat protein
MRPLRLHRTLTPLLLTAAGALHVASAAAEGPATATAPAGATSLEQQARAHFRRGVERYDDAEYALSLVEFQRAYALRPSYPLLFTIGQVHYHLGQYARARAALEEYLAQGRGNVEGTRRVQVEQQLADLRSRTAELRIAVNVAGAEVSINDEVVGASPLVAGRFVDVGPQRITASKLGYSNARKALAVVGGELAAVDLTLVELFPAPAAEPRNVPATVSWVSAGALAAGAIGTGIATMLASRRHTEMRSEPLGGSPAAARGQLEEQESFVSALALSTDVLAGASLAAAGLALYFTLRPPPDEDVGPQIQARIGPGGLTTWLEF